MTVIAAVHGALPQHCYEQAEITDAFAGLLDDPGKRRLMRRLHGSVGVRTRHLALPLDGYAALSHFGLSNDAFLSHAVDLGAQALSGALREAGLQPADVDAVYSTTVTGIAAPSLEARIAARIGLRPDVKRIPMFGLGCVAGAAGIGRLHDYLRGAPDEVAALVSVELCSLTIQQGDDSVANMVASGLFGDGAGAVVAVGDQRAEQLTHRSGPRVLASRSHLYPDTQRTMGFDVTAGGLRIVLDAHVPELARAHVGPDVGRFLAEHGLAVPDVAAWVCHPGGPKVIEAIEQSLQLPPQALELTWRSLAAVGNLSSSSVLHVLRDTLDKHPPAGSAGLLMAMGPGFCSELVLLSWT